MVNVAECTVPPKSCSQGLGGCATLALEVWVQAQLRMGKGARRARLKSMLQDHGEPPPLPDAGVRLAGDIMVNYGHIQQIVDKIAEKAAAADFNPLGLDGCTNF